VIFIVAPPAANEAVARSSIATAPPAIDVSIVTPPIEIALNLQN
jgi:hypothetical protein